MIETLAALIFAHVLADFVFQTNWMVANKSRVSGFAAHGAMVIVILLLTMGQINLPLIWLAALHMATDLAKTRMTQNLRAFLADQALHFVALTALALWRPDLWASGLWSDQSTLPALMALAAGAIVATRAGGFAIGMLMSPFAANLPETSDSLPGAGRLIGLLERGLIFALVLFGQAGGVGLLIAAKSILRFGVVKDDRALSEYVIIGTLASVGWAILAAFATQFLLTNLPPLGILPVTP